MFVFVIVGKNGKPLFEIDLQPKATQDPNVKVEKKEDAHLSTFIIHASLDIVDEAIWKNGNLYLHLIIKHHRSNQIRYLGFVDKHGSSYVSAFVTSGRMYNVIFLCDISNSLDTRFMLLHKNQKGDEHLKQFFLDINELYLKIMMNPFYQFNTPITSKAFKERVIQAAQKRLYS